MVEAMVRGYHEYQSAWENPADGEQLRCAKEPKNPNDLMAVAIQKPISSEIRYSSTQT